MLTDREKFAVFSPLLIYLLYVAFLAFLSTRPFLIRWLEGSFGLFAALVACNLIRKMLTDRKREEEEARTDPPPP